MSKCVVIVINSNHLAVFGLCAFGNNDNRVTWPASGSAAKAWFAQAIFQEMKNCFVTKGMFGYQNDVRLAGNT